MRHRREIGRIPANRDRKARDGGRDSGIEWFVERDGHGGAAGGDGRGPGLGRSGGQGRAGEERKQGEGEDGGGAVTETAAGTLPEAFVRGGEATA